MATKKDERNKAIIQNLNSHTDIIEATFTNNNLKVIGTGFCSVGDDGWLGFLIELVTLQGSSIKSNVDIKINMYSNDNTIIYSKAETIYSDYFSGYDTIHIYLNERNLAFEATRCRIFATKC